MKSSDKLLLEQNTEQEKQVISPLIEEDFNLVEIKGIPFFLYSSGNNTRYRSLNGKDYENYSLAFDSIKKEGSSVDSKIIIDEQNLENIIEIISKYIKKYVFLKNEDDYVLLATYVLLTYCYILFNRIPYLSIQGKKGSGKTTLMLILKELVSKSEIFSNISQASLYRIVDERKPTLFLDEVEFLGKKSSNNSPIAQIINSGYQKDGQVARATYGQTEKFSTFCPKILGAIEAPISTILDRCIVIQMLESEDTNILPYLNSKEDKIHQDGIKKLIEKCLIEKTPELFRLIKDNIGEMIDKEIKNRNFDKWFPLLCIAKVFSNEAKDYFQILSAKAIRIIKKNKEELDNSPENSCKRIMIDFIKNNVNDHNKILRTDKLYYYVSSEEFVDEASIKDYINVYNRKADVTTALNKAGITSSRQRFNSNPVIVYRVPVSMITN